MTQVTKELATIGGRSRFEYTGTALSGTEIAYGKTGKVSVSKDQYDNLRKNFINRIVAINTTSNPLDNDSIAGWLLANVTETRISSYVAAILVSENYAERIEKHHIRVIK